jgi:EAL domain-containing protein (putative c-di-GMP-specific phosphodiesterase class I)
LQLHGQTTRFQPKTHEFIPNREIELPVELKSDRLLAARSPLPPDGRLELEVLETTALEDMSHISLVIAACRELGVRFALDDFGTGYSSLSYLRRLPADTLKIDQSFVRDMLRDPEDRAIVAGIIRLAETFGRGVIAEGVESVDAGRALLALGCSQAQGYGIARPMPAAEFLQWARSWPDAVWGSVGSSDSVI